MDILFLLIPLSLVLVFMIGGVFWWAVRSGQFEHLDAPAYSILLDDERDTPTQTAQSKTMRDDR